MKYKYGRIFSNYNKIKLMIKIANNNELGLLQKKKIDDWHT